MIRPDSLDETLAFLAAKITYPGDIERRWYADQMIHLLRQHPQATEAFRGTLVSFSRYGFFTFSTLTKRDHEMLREKLFSFLALRISDPGEVWPSVVVLEIEKLEEDKLKKVIKLDSEIKKIRKKAFKRMKKLRSKVDHRTKVLASVVLTF